MDDLLLQRLKVRLDEALTWPCVYIFKFIVPQRQSTALIGIFHGRPTSTRSSSNGNYISVTAQLEMKSSEEVMTIYREAAKIEGIIAL